MGKKTGKVVIPSHAKAKPRRPSRAKAPVPNAGMSRNKVASSGVTSGATEGGER